MIRREPSLEAADIVIWGASCILAALIGVGISFALWTRLHHGGPTVIIYTSLAALAVGTLLIGLALQRLLVRACVMIFGFSVVLAYLFGAPGFSKLIGP